MSLEIWENFIVAPDWSAEKAVKISVSVEVEAEPRLIEEETVEDVAFVASIWAWEIGSAG